MHDMMHRGGGVTHSDSAQQAAALQGLAFQLEALRGETAELKNSLAFGFER
jgi:hypothetical protein